MASEVSNTEDEGLHYVADVDEIAESERIIVEVNGREIGVFNINGEFHALLNYCTHQGGPVCEGPVTGTMCADEDFQLEYCREDEILSCPWHAWEFDARTGEHLAQTGHKIPTYEVVTKDGSIYLK
jgi:nitrite reductase/ring-hydroxylating ferredoxin subunit